MFNPSTPNMLRILLPAVLSGAAAWALPDPLRESELLACIPEEAFALVHLPDPAGLQRRAEQNEWIQAWNGYSRHSIWTSLERELRFSASVDFEGMLELGGRLEGESLLFLTGSAAGFFTVAPAQRGALSEALQALLAPSPRSTLEIGEARVVLSTWAGEDRKTTRNKKSFLCFVDHPRVLSLVSGSSRDEVLGVVTDALGALGTDRQSPLVAGFVSAGGGGSRGLQAYVDFTPFVGDIERSLREMSTDILPDPTGLLGLEQGTDLLVTADVSPGRRLQVDVELSIPKDTLAARLADTFEPLPATYPAELPSQTWTCFAIDWNIGRFHDIARKSLEEVDESGLAVVDSGLQTAEAMTGVDPVEDVIHQFDGLFSIYFERDPGRQVDDDQFGLLFGLVDGDHFFDAVEAVLEGLMAPAQNVLIEGAETFVFTGGAEEWDGGMAILAQRALVALSRSQLERGVRALNGVEAAGLDSTSRLVGAFDENPGAFAFAYVRFLPFYELALSVAAARDQARVRGEDGGSVDPAQGQGDPLREVDGDFVLSARRTVEGFFLRYYTR